MVDILKAGGEIRKFQEPLLKYRIHKGQITAKSEAEQIIYQWLVSSDYIGYTFPTLNINECAVIASLGYDCSPEFLMDYREKVNISYLKRSQNYIDSVKKVIKYNEKTKLYDTTKLEVFLRCILWKKCIRMTRQYRRPWGMWPYTLLGYFTFLRHNRCLVR